MCLTSWPLSQVLDLVVFIDCFTLPTTLWHVQYKNIYASSYQSTILLFKLTSIYICVQCLSKRSRTVATVENFEAENFKSYM